MRIISFIVDTNAKAPKASDAKRLNPKGNSPCSLFDQRSCEIEGLTLRTIWDDQRKKDVDQFLLGVKKVNGVPTIAIVAIEPELGGWLKPTVVFKTEDLDDGCNHRSGVSDLTDGPSGSIYMLTSVELESTDLGCGASGAGGMGVVGTASGGSTVGTGGAGDTHLSPLSAVAQVGGALWFLPTDILDKKGAGASDGGAPKGRPTLVQQFAHKPEGVADLADGAMLIVFDDEGHRKSRTWAPDTFALNQNESVFAVVPAAALRPDN